MTGLRHLLAKPGVKPECVFSMSGEYDGKHSVKAS